MFAQTVRLAPTLYWHQHLVIGPEYIYNKSSFHQNRFVFLPLPSCPWSPNATTLSQAHTKKNPGCEIRCYVTIELYTGVPAGLYLAVKSLLLFKQGGALLDLSVVCLWLTSAPPGSPCGLRKCKGYRLVSKRVYRAWGFLLSPLVDEWILLHNCDISRLVQKTFMMRREACMAA